MAQNQAHMGDVVSPTVGELKGQEGTVTGLRFDSNQCMVRIATDDPTLFRYRNYDGAELKLIDCYHMGVITSE